MTIDMTKKKLQVPTDHVHPVFAHPRSYPAKIENFKNGYSVLEWEFTYSNKIFVFKI